MIDGTAIVAYGIVGGGVYAGNVDGVGQNVVKCGVYVLPGVMKFGGSDFVGTIL